MTFLTDLLPLRVLLLSLGGELYNDLNVTGYAKKTSRTSHEIILRPKGSRSEQDTCDTRDTWRKKS